MQVIFNRPRRQEGYILLGALALAVIIAVAVSMALLSSQQKVDETKGKEANIEARLALDSTASRIITRLDQQLEYLGSYYSDDVTNVLAGTTAGSYTVATINPLPGIELDPYAIELNPLKFHTVDPLFPDLRMNTQDVIVSNLVTSTKAGTSNYISAYTFQVRAMPVSDFALFNPGVQTEQIGIANNPYGLISDGSNTQTTVPIYVGRTLAGTNAPFLGSSLHVLNASSNGIATRLFRSSVLNGTNYINQGSPKWDNAAARGFAAFRGQFANFTQSGFYSAASAFLDYGSLSSSSSQSPSGLIDPIYKYHDTETGIGGSADFYNQYNYTLLTSGSPLYNVSSGGYVATLDLGAAMGQSGPYSTLQLGARERTLLLDVPQTNSTIVSTIIVTNSASLPFGMNITFPPSVLVLIADHVNTNMARLRMQGNIGFLPVGSDILSITNSLTSSRTTPGPYIVSQSFTISQTNIPVITQTGTNVPSQYLASASAADLYEDLKVWAQAQQAALLSQPDVSSLPAQPAHSWAINATAANIDFMPVSSGPNPYYTPQASLVTYFDDFLAVFPIANVTEAVYRGINLPSTSYPLDSSYSLTATNLIEVTHTNYISQYGFGGNNSAQACDPSSGVFTYLVADTSVIDPLIPTNAIRLDTTLTLSDQTTTSGTNIIAQDFSTLDPVIGPLFSELHGSIANPVTLPNLNTASLYTWLPVNSSPLPGSALLGSLHDNTNDLYRTITFAFAWMTVQTNVYTTDGQYYESYQEFIQKMQINQDQQYINLSTNNLGFVGFLSSDTMADGITTWYNYLNDNWSAIQGGYVQPVAADSFRYTTTGAPGQAEGAWKLLTSTVTKDNYISNQNETRDQYSFGTNEFNNFFVRQVTFHYETFGWVSTNLNLSVGPAPSFNGRLVVEDGLKEVLAFVPTNMVVNGQVTYTHPVRAPLQDNSIIMQNYSITHDQRVYPVDCAERLYDVRISHVTVNKQ